MGRRTVVRKLVTRRTYRAAQWMRLVGLALLALALYLGSSAWGAVLLGNRSAGTVISIGRALTPTSTRSAYSVVVSYTHSDGSVQRVERELQAARIDRIPLGAQRWRRLQPGDPVTVATRGQVAELLHPHAAWAGAATILAGALLLIVMSFVVQHGNARA